ncbi:MAG TPA: GGDEF domain-containing protein [Lactobacillus sp.]|nr:GGDEF domain-containing protein [Lactobacillus sp.]
MKRTQINNASLLADVCLLVFLALLTVTAIFFGATPSSLLLNTLYLGISIALIMTTYFFSLTTGLTLNLVFMFIQGLVMVYLNLVQHQAVKLPLVFWLIMPVLLSLSFYGMTAMQRLLQEKNERLATDMVERGAFDAQTNLRTTVSYVEDASVYLETHDRFKIPLTTVIIRVRYYSELERMMSDDQLDALIRLVSDMIVQSTRGNDIGYILDTVTPTWGTLMFTDASGAKIAAQRIRDNFAKAATDAPALATMDLSLVIGVAEYNGQMMHNAYDLMNAGIKETEYDV